jgi:hypothetical protein
MIHEEAHKFGFETKSYGQNSVDRFLIFCSLDPHTDRYICVYKGTKQPLNKNWFSIPVGVCFILENLDHAFYIGSGLDARNIKYLEGLGESVLRRSVALGFLSG